ncbi:MAG TPA: NAD(P) transhydrogenase subunit alpha [Trueperaceae bacterium]|nr:NAD(P) transhydrogenase subunit alpha [Trueperaceae bacterium]
MNIVALKETAAGERRIGLTPAIVDKLVRLGMSVTLESGVGASLHLADEAFEKVGASFGSDRAALLQDADVLVSVNKPTDDVISGLREGAVNVSFLDPFRSGETVRALADAGVSAFCMELIPRTSYAQKMDALSSQASLAGYAAVIIAAERIDKSLPMMSTPAGTIPPARVFVVGAGVAGLQAIATAKRLGARVEAYDTRPVVKEQVQSLGARFVEIDVGETGQTEQGYAKALTEEQLEMQRQQMAKICAGADIIVTTAQVFGRAAPKIISADMVAGMRPGAVIVDLAASTGGNVDGTEPGEEVLTGNGVLIVGLNNFPAEIARDASQMFASNVYYLLEHAFDKEAGSLKLDTEDDVIAAALLTHEGQIRDERVRGAVLEGSK